MSVYCGIDRVDEFAAVFKGLRLGLITGASGMGRNYKPSVDILNEKCDLRALFSPEHGIRGELQPGAKVETRVDKHTGLPAYSLFADEMNADMSFNRERAYMPSEEAMSLIDAMVFDIQDVGSRYFTFASSMFYAMRACAMYDKQFIVLDRPNPIGGVRVEGNIHRPENLSFIGLTRVPIRHGLTLGELARFYNGEYKLGAALTVIPVGGWTRDMYFDETRLPFVCPSPNLPGMNAIALYNGVCMFAGTNVSEGRGTTKPFELVYAPFIDPMALTDALTALKLPGVMFAPAWALPQFSKYAGVPCAGVQIFVTDIKQIEPVKLGVNMLRVIQRMYPEDFEFSPPKNDGRWHIDLSSGTDELRNSALSAYEILAGWEKEAAEFKRVMHSRYRIYGE